MQEADRQDQAGEGRALAEAARRHAASEQGLQMERDQLTAQVRLPSSCYAPHDSEACSWRCRWLSHAGTACLCLHAATPALGSW